MYERNFDVVHAARVYGSAYKTRRNETLFINAPLKKDLQSRASSIN